MYMSKKYYIPKKKKHTGLIIFLIIFGILVVFPVGFVFGAFFTTSTKEVSDTTVHYENVVSESFYKGLDGLNKEHPQIDFTINEDMFDGIMMAACDKIGQKQFIPKMYCYIDDNDYTFIVDLQFSFFKTRALLYTNLSSAGEGLEETMVFKINGVTIGRLPIPLNWVTGIMGNFINDEMLNNAFDQSGFHLKSDLANMQLTYNRATFRDDAYNYLVKLGRENPYLKILLYTLGDSEILETDFKDGVTASFHLDKMLLPLELKTPLNFSELDKHSEKIVEWLNLGETYLAEGDVYKMFSYLIRGYSCSNEEIQEYINKINISDDCPIKAELLKYINGGSTSYSNLIALNEYEGSKVDGNTTFKQFCEINEGKKDIEVEFNYTLPNSVTFKIGTESLNKFLIRTMNKAIGMTIPLTYTDKNNLWHFAYIVIDNLFVTFQENSGEVTMTMHLVLNMLGVRLVLDLIANDIKIVDTSSEEGEVGKLHFNLKEASFGTIPIEDMALLDEILVMIPSAGENNIFTYQKDGDKRSFFINLDKVFPSGIEEDAKKAIAGIIADPGVKTKPGLTTDKKDFQIEFTRS